MTTLNAIYRWRRTTAAAAAVSVMAIGALSAGCAAGTTAPSVQVKRSATPTREATPTPLPGGFDLLREGGLGVIEVAYNRIVDEHVAPVDEAALLSAAWDGVRTAARKGEMAEPQAPQFTGDRASDIERFRAAWRALPEELEYFPGTRWTAISSMAKSLNDCHTYFMGPSLNDPTGGQDRTLSGYGMTMMGRPAVVTDIEKEPWSPAAVSGIQPGDTILSIDFEDATHMAPLDVLIALDGHEEGSSVNIRVQRPGAAEPITETLALSPYEPKNVLTKVLDGNIGYLRVHEWSTPRLARQIADALAKFDKAKVTRWVIDLRGNPGGIVSPDVISLFVTEGVAMRTRGRDGIVHDEPASGATLASLKPLDVLVDDGSASMSEAFALALQEHHAAHIVGAKTYGCIGETYVDGIGDGSGLAVTRALVLGPVTGAELNGIGVTPDEVVPRTVDDIVAGRDPQLDAAIAHLKSE